MSVKSVIMEEFNSYTKNIKITLVILAVLFLGFLASGIQILFFGLGYTDMNNIFAMGIWIGLDLSFVVLGGGAFFTGFILYIFRNDKLQPIINSAVLIGFLCYLFTLVLLVFDIGQPIRAVFAFMYPNWGTHLMPKSMLTEVVFCLSLYFSILFIEMIPIVFKHKVLDKFPIIHGIGHYLHKIMWIFAAAGTFLSIFHQGSLGGGMWGVLFGKAGWYRTHLFFLAIAGAMAAGPSFIILCTWIAGKVKKKEVVPKSTFHSLAKISGIMFIIYFVFRIYDLYQLNTVIVPAFDRSFLDLWGGYYGIWILVVELTLCFIPVILLNIKKLREKENLMVIGVSSAVVGMLFHKFGAILLHGFSVPNFPWKPFNAYMPSPQEWLLSFGSVACMILIYMWCAKYLPFFPHLEKDQH
ncbi:NrfD/PsrC family molybdoenzyme membrane anchor subunit [Spirochaetota bacterium]